MCLALNKGRLGRAGFSLTELLVVIGIIGIMAAAGLPALKGITGSTGRTGAINGLMSALDQARSAAIASGANAYVVFPDQALSTLPATASFNPSNYVYRSYAIFRDPNPDLGETTTNAIQIGKWESLPQGVALVSSNFNSPFPRLTNRLISLPGTNASNLPAIGFHSSGGLIDPPATNGITVYEGYWNGSREVLARVMSNQIVDRITLNRFTGRAFLSMTNMTNAF